MYGSPGLTGSLLGCIWLAYTLAYMTVRIGNALPVSLIGMAFCTEIVQRTGKPSMYALRDSYRSEIGQLILQLIKILMEILF